MSKKIDIIGQRFGRVVVVKEVPRPDHRKGQGLYYLCICDCGKEKVMNGFNIRHNFRKYGALSCGCRRAERLREHFTTHGLTNTDRHEMWMRSGARAKQKGWDFTIRPEDIPDIPTICPYLGIPIFKIGRVQSANSPSLDRIDPSKGYVKGNIQIISNKANIMKNNASFAEFEIFYKNWRAMIQNGAQAEKAMSSAA